ncbi:MAG: aminopeptidase P family protein [Chitinophagaceae bacterium]|nr:aminopeptidase P family protein [Chitinophagaceae bacterium]
MKSSLLFVIFSYMCISQSVLAQAPAPDLPQDFLSKEFHAGRRDSLRGRMPANSVTAVFAFPTRTFSNDVEYVYHQNPDLYYFTGYKEPHGMLLIFKEPQKDSSNNTYKELFFIQKRDAAAEQWTGRRIGIEGVKTILGIDHTYNGEQFQDYNIDLTKFEQILFEPFPADVADDRLAKGDLFDLMQQFREKAKIPEDYSKDKRYATGLYRQITGSLREVKTDEEMDLLRKAVEISCIGQLEVMKAVRADMSETEIQGLHEYVHKKYGAEEIGYPSIVGAGNNGCVLHYVDNNKTRVGQQLILMDVGAEYHGYTADVTRTIPANGKFSNEQKIIYNIVYQAQEEAFKKCKEGVSWQELNKTARDVVTEGLVKLGIAATKEEANKYYPHSLGHHIGLDVHDRNSSSKLKKGMVITIEPGIYIPDNSPCDKKWWGIAVRIEDDLLIKEKDYELLSSAAPRKVEDIEKAIAEKSALDDFVLPKLKSGKKGF